MPRMETMLSRAICRSYRENVLPDSTPGTGGQGLDAEKVKTLLVLGPRTPLQLTVLSLHSGDCFLQDKSNDWLQTSLISLALMYISTSKWGSNNWEKMPHSESWGI